MGHSCHFLEPLAAGVVEVVVVVAVVDETEVDAECLWELRV
jgi:hypothetical protein